MKTLAALCLFSALNLHLTGPVEVDHSKTNSLSATELIERASYLTQEEKAMIWELNLVRTEPRAYIPHVQEVLEYIIADSVNLSKMTSETIRKTVSYEGDKEIVNVDTTYNNYFNSRVTAIRELLYELKNTAPMSHLVPSERLFMAAKKHGQRQAPYNYIDHMGHDGTWPLDRMRTEAQWITDGNENIARGKGSPRDIVIQLLIDSGVPSRGHRKNILNPDWEYVTCHNVSRLNSNGVKWWLQEFAY